MSGADAGTLARVLRELQDGAVSGEGMLDTSLQRVVDACAALFDIAGCGLMLADENGQLRYVVATDTTSQLIEDAQLSTGEGPCVDAYLTEATTTTEDVGADTRWPAFSAALRRGSRSTSVDAVGAVLGTPLRLGDVVVGSLDVHHTAALTWSQDQVRDLVRFGRVAEAMLVAGLQAHRHGELVTQLDRAIAHRAPIERGVGYLMARDGLGQQQAFGRLRSAARSARRPIGEVARTLTVTGRLPGEKT